MIVLGPMLEISHGREEVNNGTSQMGRMWSRLESGNARFPVVHPIGQIRTVHLDNQWFRYVC